MLGLLLLVDLLLITSHVTRGIWQEPTSRLFDLTVETGYGEFFQAVKSGWCVVVLACLAWWRRSWLYVAWGGVCVFLVADDVLSLHEFAGSWIGRTMGDGSQSAAHWGEVIFLAGVGVLIVPIAWLSWRFPRRWDRLWLRRLTVLVGALAFFGVVVDALHSFVFWHHTLTLTMTTIEDGGELVVMSLILAVLVAAHVLGHRHDDDVPANPAPGRPAGRPATGSSSPR